jgi:hypothetical protein
MFLLLPPQAVIGSLGTLPSPPQITSCQTLGQDESTALQPAGIVLKITALLQING